MGVQPSQQDWEQVVGSDLMPHLIPAGQPRDARRPADVSWLPPDAHQALGEVIGRHGLEDLLIVPPAVWWRGQPWRRCLYAPLCVLGVGERAAALWVQALPQPCVRVVVPFSEVAMITQEAAGPQRRLIITGRGSRLLVRYDLEGGMAADALARRIRRRAAGDPFPGQVPGISRGLGRAARRLPDPAALRLDDDQIAVIGSGSLLARQKILLAVTSRELIIVSGRRAERLRRGRVVRTLYIPRQRIENVGHRSGTLRLRSAGQDVSVGLRSRRLAAAASSCLAQALSGRGRTCADSGPAPG
jgi:hypothetical protein